MPGSHKAFQLKNVSSLTTCSTTTTQLHTFQHKKKEKQVDLYVWPYIHSSPGRGNNIWKKKKKKTIIETAVRAIGSRQIGELRLGVTSYLCVVRAVICTGPVGVWNTWHSAAPRTNGLPAAGGSLREKKKIIWQHLGGYICISRCLKTDISYTRCGRPPSSIAQEL